MALPSSVVYALGQGFSPLINLSIVTAGFVKSICPNSFVIFPAYDDFSSSCGVLVAVPFSSFDNVSTINFPSSIASYRKDFHLFLFRLTFMTAVSITSPVSSPSAMYIVVTPVSSSPSITAH